MNEMQTIATTPNDREEEKDFDLLRMLIVLAKHKKLFIILPLIAAAVGAAISFAIPNSYRANAKILPPQQAQSGAAALLAQLGGVAGAAAAGASGIKNPNDLYIGMLKSRTIADKVIARNDLKKVYDTPSAERARQVLEENTTIKTAKDGLIVIEVEDYNKQLVAKITNSYVQELLALTKVLAVTEAAQRRMFFERQLEQSKDNLAQAEMTLKGALDTHGVISVDSDSRAIVETVSRLRAQIASKEIQLSAMQAFVTVNNQDYKRTQEELKSLRAELSKLENGRPGIPEDAAQPARKQIGLENIKILREVKYHQMLYELLSKQYEVARLDETKDTSIIQVLDPANEPERKFKPKRAILILLSALLGLVAAIAWAFACEAKNSVLQAPERAEQWNTLKSHLRFK